jgi:hypothetical protein
MSSQLGTDATLGGIDAARAALRTVARAVGGIRRKLTYLASTSSFR